MVLHLVHWCQFNQNCPTTWSSFTVWLMSCLPMTRDEWQSDPGVKKQDLSWQITSESLIDRLTCLTRWGMRMKMMTRRSQSIWRIDFHHQKKTWNKKEFLGPGVWSYVCSSFVCSRWPDLHSKHILNGHFFHLQESRRRRAALMAKPVTPVMTCDGTAPVTYHLPMHGCQVQGWEGLSEQSCEQSFGIKKGLKVSATYNYLLLIIFVY